MSRAKAFKIKYLVAFCLALILGVAPVFAAENTTSNKNTGIDTVEQSRENKEKDENSLLYSEKQLLPETKDILVDIDGDVTITLISSERDFAMGEYIEYYYDMYSKNTSYYYDLVNTLKTMAEYNDYIKVRFIDPFAVYSQKFLDDNSKHKLQYGDILINCYSNFDGNAKVRNSVISANELFEIKKDDSGKKEIVGIKAEETISKKLKALRSKRDINVAYISELCEETDIVKLKKYLSGSGYNFDEISLKDSKLQGYDMILIVSPMRDVTLEEMVILDSFLENNGKKNKNLMLFCPKEYIKLENLYSFVSKWGIGLSDEHRLTSTGDGYFSDPTQIYGECEQTEYTKNSTNENGMYIMDMCTPILIEETGNPIYTVKGLLYSKSDKLNWMNINEDSEKINLNDKKYPLFVLSEKQVDKKISRVGVCSSTDFITTYFALQNPKFSKNYSGETCKNMDLVKSVFEQMNKKHRKDKSELEDYTVDEKEMGIEVTSELKHSYILTVAFGGVAIFAVIMFVLLTVLNRRKKSGF